MLGEQLQDNEEDSHLFLQGVFSPQPSAKPALYEITYSAPVALSLACKLLGAKPLSPAPTALPAEQ